ncbi:hypothetical protein OG889_44370 [Streptomyces sp. NBC_00481]|uniref:hypothetical protein n=1 Tax=Streptomyces sp. NBC_00481 TaxID=2975755 RepID=UPI002DDB5F89|nr:hypothetical protein [Streptomyces sp. NBC_00481]WRZ01101.1 hypothetical protein OG889_44370 [Streptomyces sp. NBC_00481]
MSSRHPLKGRVAVVADGHAAAASPPDPAQPARPCTSPAAPVPGTPFERGRPETTEETAALVQEAGGADGHRDDLCCDPAEHAVVRLARAQAAELARHHVAAVAVTPGLPRSQAMPDHVGVSEENRREAIAADALFAFSASPRHLRRGVARPAADPHAPGRSGDLYASWELAEEHGFTDVTGDRPDWRHRSR